jgi:aryl-alcohol dehydrogenase-like predicted oxidoreductase
MKQMDGMELGCGLIRIGRAWGFKKKTIPTAEKAQNFLQEAVHLGLRFFDTAPSYALSEERLGIFLHSLPQDIRNTLTIATKCGEYWDAEKQEPIIDHSYSALTRSIDASLARLGSIDMLQIHKATPEVLKSPAVHKALSYAKSRGIKQFGASVSDRETAELVCGLNEFCVVQLPFNAERTDLQETLQKLKKAEKFLIINRPFNMGSILYKNQKRQSKQQMLSEAYAFILKECFSGVILTGTCDVKHLKENLTAFTKARHQLYEK